jgi:peptidoglycan/LPS O-acetylase OafA/YrhL
MGTVRFLLALWVVVAHSKGSTILGIPLFSGTTAVQCFYVVSGFLITFILNERKAYRSLRNFYISRYLRLWPVYLVVAGFALAIRGPMPELPTAAEVFFAISNLTLFFQDWFLFLKFDDDALAFTADFAAAKPPAPYQFLLVPQAWSLGIELSFYLIAPFLCRHWWRLALLFAASLALRFYLGTLPLQIDPWSYRFMPAEMVFFASGGLAYFVGRATNKRFPGEMRITGFVCIVAFVGLTVGAKIVSPGLPYINNAYWPEIMLLNPQVMIFTIIAVAPLFYATQDSWLDAHLGELSYPIYLCHVLVNAILTRYVPETLLAGNVLYVVCVIVASFALYFGVTVFVDRIRKRYGARAIDFKPEAPSPQKVSPAQR